MKFVPTLFILSALFINQSTNAQKASDNIVQSENIDHITALKDSLTYFSTQSENPFFIEHCNSIIRVINMRSNMALWESDLLKELYYAIIDETDTCKFKELSTYTKRRRPFIISWISPTDGNISVAKLKPPKNWDPDKEYPLYVSLHGQSGDAQSNIKYMVTPFLNNASTDSSFSDGYLLSPWGRGNSMYINMGEKDIWECIDVVEKFVKIDPTRKYLAGLSMGGYGTWHIGTRSPGTWAALGIYAGVLAYNNKSELNIETAQKIKDVPTYIICGTEDILFPSNETGYNLLVEAGNLNLEFITFPGEHEFFGEYIMDMYLWMRNFVNEDWYNTDVENQQVTNEENELRNYPNPFSGETSIYYSLNGNEEVHLEIYNNLGQLTEVLISTFQPAGVYEIKWKPKNLSSGMYICRLRTGKMIRTARIILE